MNSRRTFDIAFVGLKPGIHEFEYEINDRFFVEYQEQDFKNVSAHVKLALDKKNGFMLLRFEIGGKLEVTCDRCGNNLPLELWDEFNIVVKMVEEAEAHRAEVQRFADKFTAYFIPVVLGIAALTFLFSQDVLATAAVLVVACSCSIAFWKASAAAAA